MAESRCEGLIENKVLVIVAWSSPPFSLLPYTSLSFVFLHLPLLNCRHIYQYVNQLLLVHFWGRFPASVFVSYTIGTLINFTLPPALHRNQGSDTFSLEK